MISVPPLLRMKPNLFADLVSYQIRKSIRYRGTDKSQRNRDEPVVLCSSGCCLFLCTFRCLFLRIRYQTVELPRPELFPARRALIEARGSVPGPLAWHRTPPTSRKRSTVLRPGAALVPGPAGSGEHPYSTAWSLRLRRALDIGALERSLGEIVRRHETLRTTFREVDGSPVQVIAPFGGFTLSVEDFSGLAEADREWEVRRRVTEDAPWTDSRKHAPRRLVEREHRSA
jgi:hypothetical protein